MLEMGTSGLMSGDKKRDDARASAPALVLGSTIAEGRFCLWFQWSSENKESGAGDLPSCRCEGAEK